MNYNIEKIYDISMPIQYMMPVYNGKQEKRPVLINECNFSVGNFYESSIAMNLHTGTHIDSKLHMLPDGNCIDTFDLNRVITECKVIDLTTVSEKITCQDLMNKDISEGDFVLLKTKNSFQDILEKDFIYLDRSGAEFLVEKKIKGVGIDALGIERNQLDHGTHITLMKSDILILEGLRLNNMVTEGEYLLFAAPLNIVGAEAAPVRALLIGK